MQQSNLQSAREVKYGYGKINIGIPVFMDDIATTGKAEHINKGIKNCARMEKETKINFGLKKKIYKIVKTGGEEEEINETIRNMFNASSSVWDGSLEKVVKSRNSKCRKNSR